MYLQQGSTLTTIGHQSHNAPISLNHIIRALNTPYMLVWQRFVAMVICTWSCVRYIDRNLGDISYPSAPTLLATNISSATDKNYSCYFKIYCLGRTNMSGMWIHGDYYDLFMEKWIVFSNICHCNQPVDVNSYTSVCRGKARGHAGLPLGVPRPTYGII